MSTEGINIPISLTLDTVVGTRPGRWSGNPDDEPEYEPITLLDTVIEALVNRLYADAKRSTERAVRAVENQVADILKDLVGEKVEELFRSERMFTPTSRYGEPKGEPQTLMEVVTEAAKSWPTASKDDGWGGRKKPNLQGLMEEALQNGFERELKPIIDQAKAQVKAAVQQQASQVLAKTITDLASRPNL